MEKLPLPMQDIFGVITTRQTNKPLHSCLEQATATDVRKEMSVMFATTPPLLTVESLLYFSTYNDRGGQ